MPSEQNFTFVTANRVMPLIIILFEFFYHFQQVMLEVSNNSTKSLDSEAFREKVRQTPDCHRDIFPT